MMQQVASVKPESAASALPLEFSNDKTSNSGSRESFDNVFQQQSNQPTAFAQARQNAENSAFSNAERTRNDSRGDSRNDAISDAKKNAQAPPNSREQNAGVSSKAEDRNYSDLENSEARYDKLASDTNEQTQVEIAGNISNTVHSSAPSTTTTDDLGNLLPALSEGESGDGLESGAANSEDFDYINFVSQLAEFTGNDAYINTNELPNIDLYSINLEATSITAPQVRSGDISPTYLKEDEQNTDLLKIGINKEQLQVILDAQNVQLDLSAELNEQDLLKLQSIIANMLNKLEQSNTGGETLNDAELEQVKLADQALMASLLLNPENSETSAQKKFSQESHVQVNASVDGQSRKATDASLKAELALKAPLDVAGSPDNKKRFDEPVRSEIPGFGHKLSEKDVWRTMPDLSEIKILPDNKAKPDIVKTPIDNIVALNDEQTKLAANSLNERLQTLVSDLKSEGKGNEFIAALQSSLKEFKQQLSQGREPGINVKDMIAEALASANIDTDKAVQPKIDAAVNQFNAVLNLANALNYSANQQQAQGLGTTDTQLAKEINHQQIEGTKLANGLASNVANTLSSQVNNDKAINIGKAEGQVQLAEKVRWMVNSRNPSAEIRLDPPDLGGINIKVNLSGDTAQVNFTVQSMVAKEALDQAVPRLRDMLQQQGIELGQSSVKQDSQGQQNAEQQGQLADSGQSNSGAKQSGSDDMLEAAQDFSQGIIEQRISGSSLGGIDYYA